MSLIRIVIADDHAVMRMGIRSLLTQFDDIQVVGEAANGVEALAAVEKHHPDVLLLDMQMPVKDGVQVAEELQTSRSPVKVLAFSAYDDRVYVQSLLDYGAAGYLLKDDDPALIIEAVRRVASGEVGWVSKKIKLSPR